MRTLDAERERFGARRPRRRRVLVATTIAALVSSARAQEGSEVAPHPNEPPAAIRRPDSRFLHRFQILPDGTVLTPTPHVGDLSRPTTDLPPLPEEGGNVVVAPIPFVSPTIGYGLALGAAYVFPLDAKSPPSTIGGGGLYSENGSLGGAVGFKGYFDEDRYRVTAALAFTRLNIDYATDARGVPIGVDALGVALEVLVRSFERVYVGPQLIFSGLDTRLRRNGDEGVIPDDELEADNLGLGMRVQRDTRDSTFYPRSGSIADLQVRVFDPALGSKFSYQAVPLHYNHYLSLGERDVLALRASGRFALGDVPFYGESYFGSNADLRGYTVGDVHDDVLLAAQAEYRRELIGRLGGVVFGGLGTVTPALDELGDAEALYSLGFGLRFLLEKTNHINFRLDFAWGEDTSAIYLGVGEAF